MKLKIVTLNIHKGFSLGNRRATLHKIKSNLSRVGAEIVCLQEVVGAHETKVKRAQFEELADSIWHHHAYGKNAIYSEGHHGNAILSKFPFVEYENFNVSNHRLEQRGILHGVVTAPEWNGKKLHVMTLHLDLTGWGRRRQTEKLCALIETRVPEDEPLLVCGDFNDWREEVSEFLQERVGLTEAHWDLKGTHARTYPSKYPLLKLDRIYVRGLKVEQSKCLKGQGWSDLSDHLALYAELSVK